MLLLIAYPVRRTCPEAVAARQEKSELDKESIMTSKKTRLTVIAVALTAATQLQGCAVAMGAAAGAAVGYGLKDNGYEVRSPIHKTGQ